MAAPERTSNSIGTLSRHQPMVVQQVVVISHKPHLLRTLFDSLDGCVLSRLQIEQVQAVEL